MAPSHAARDPPSGDAGRHGEAGAVASGSVRVPGARRPREWSRLVLLGIGAGITAGAFQADRLLGGTAGFCLSQWVLLACGLAASLAASLRLRAVHGVLLLVSSLIVASGLAEVAVWLLWRLDLSSIHRPHAGRLYDVAPGTSRRFPLPPGNAVESVVVSINDDGYRGAALARPAGGLRVAVFGDSFIEDDLTPQDETFCARLASRLAEALGRPVEVVNAGVFGYGPDQCLLKQEERLPRLAPDVVVTAVYAGNDWGDLLRNRLFHLDGDGQLVRDEPRLCEARLAEFWRGAHWPFALRLVDRAKNRSHLFSVEARPAVDAGAALEACGREYADWLGPDRVVCDLFTDHYDADVALEPAGPSAVEKVRLMSAVLRRVQALAASLDVPALLLIVPPASDVCGSAPYGRVDAGRYPRYRPGGLCDRLAGIAAELGFPCVDLFPLFARSDPCSLYLVGDPHWSPRGQDLAAAEVAASLEARLTGRQAR